MAQSLFQDPPQAQGDWNVNLSKMALLFWQSTTGAVALSTSVPGSGISPATPGFVKTYTYFGSTNNIQTITYSQDGTTTGKVAYTYVAGGVADNDDIATETWSAS